MDKFAKHWANLNAKMEKLRERNEVHTTEAISTTASTADRPRRPSNEEDWSTNDDENNNNHHTRIVINSAKVAEPEEEIPPISDLFTQTQVPMQQCFKNIELLFDLLLQRTDVEVADEADIEINENIADVGVDVGVADEAAPETEEEECAQPQRSNHNDGDDNTVATATAMTVDDVDAGTKLNSNASTDRTSANTPIVVQNTNTNVLNNNANAKPSSLSTTNASGAESKPESKSESESAATNQNCDPNTNTNTNAITTTNPYFAYTLTPQMIQNIDTSKPIEFVFLLSTGSLNPVHCGHTDMMISAKLFFDAHRSQCNQIVIGGYLSPSHDDYVESKFWGSKNFIPNAYRLQLIHNATKASEWLSYSSYEACERGFVDYPSVAREVQRLIREQFLQYCDVNQRIQAQYERVCSKFGGNSFGGFKLQVYYVCGMDHALKCRLLRGMSGIGVCVICRPGYGNTDNNNNKKNKNKYLSTGGQQKGNSGALTFDDNNSEAQNMKNLKQSLQKRVVVCKSHNTSVIDDRSSTMAREYMRHSEWHKLEALLHPCNVAYLQESSDFLIRKFLL